MSDNQMQAAVNPVITRERAREIVGKASGPLTIELYERAVDCLRQCLTLDEAKYFGDAATAWEALAKLQHDERALRLARELKQEWGKRCAKIALSIRGSRRSLGNSGSAPAAKSLLESHGMTSSEASGALRLARGEVSGLSPFSGRPYSLSSLKGKGYKRERAWWSSSLNYLLLSVRREDPRQIARSSRAQNLQQYIDSFIEISAWGARFIKEAEKILKDQGKAAK